MDGVGLVDETTVFHIQRFKSSKLLSDTQAYQIIIQRSMRRMLI